MRLCSMDHRVKPGGDERKGRTLPDPPLPPRRGGGFGIILAPVRGDEALAGDAVGPRAREPEQRRHHDRRSSSVAAQLVGKAAGIMPVSVAPPGSSALTVTPVPARSCAQMMVSDSSAAFDGP